MNVMDCLDPILDNPELQFLIVKTRNDKYKAPSSVEEGRFGIHPCKSYFTAL